MLGFLERRIKLVLNKSSKFVRAQKGLKEGAGHLVNYGTARWKIQGGANSVQEKKEELGSIRRRPETEKEKQGNVSR